MASLIGSNENITTRPVVSFTSTYHTDKINVTVNSSVFYKNTKSYSHDFVSFTSLHLSDFGYRPCRQSVGGTGLKRLSS